jgi:hypothetical protein
MSHKLRRQNLDLCQKIVDFASSNGTVLPESRFIEIVKQSSNSLNEESEKDAQMEPACARSEDVCDYFPRAI